MQGPEATTVGNNGNAQFTTEVTDERKLSEKLTVPEKLGGKTETFSAALDLLEQYATDHKEQFPSEAIDNINRALVIVDETSREVGYHDKKHGLDFAAALVTQAIAARGLLDKEDDADIREFVRQRMGDEYATDEFIKDLRETLTVEKITNAATVGLMHDRAELEGRDKHEERAAEQIGGEDWPDEIKYLAIPIIHSTKYSGEVGRVYDKWEEEGEYDAADKLLGRLANASDFLDKMGDEQYFSLEYTELLDNLPELSLEQIRNYPLLLLSAEFYNNKTLIYPNDIPSNLVARGFIDGTQEGHESSFKLIQDSEIVPGTLKERFTRRGFDEAERNRIIEMIIDTDGNSRLSELVIRSAYLLREEISGTTDSVWMLREIINAQERVAFSVPYLKTIARLEQSTLTTAAKNNNVSIGRIKNDVIDALARREELPFGLLLSDQPINLEGVLDSLSQARINAHFLASVQGSAN